MTVLSLPIPPVTSDPDLRLVAALSQKLTTDEPALARADSYYNGTQPLAFLAPEVEAQVGDRLPALVINWPRVIVNSVSRRTFVEGFTLGQGGQADDELWRIWQANNLDEWSQLAQDDALVHRASFLSVWGNTTDPQTPRINVESAHQLAVQYRPGNPGEEAFEISAALKRWSDGERIFSTLYRPDRVRRYASRISPTGAVGALEQIEELANPMGVVPIVPLVNRPRVLNLDGQSELADIMPLADAINKLATDMMVSSEFHATPRRWATGMQVPSAHDARERMQAEVREMWDKASKDKTWLAGPGANFGQFAEAQLTNFVAAINLLTSMVAAIGGLPPDDLGLNTTNPASAEARRAADTTLILRAEEKMRSWGGSYERTMRYAIAARDGVPVRSLPTSLARMETIWRDPKTPTVAQTADAAVKLHNEGIFDAEQAREFVGLSPVQRRAIAVRAEAAAAQAATADVRARVALARELAGGASVTLTPNAALAAAGLLQAASTNSAEGAPQTPA